MATGKRYYWIKLKESFMNSDTVDYLMSKPNGANYVVLYQMLCLKTINTDGRLSRRIGEVIIPYDVEKIQRDCKWFSADTIRIALRLYHSFGLIYEDVDGTLVLADHRNLVGSETDWAEKRRRQRIENGDAPTLHAGDNVPANVPQSVPIDIRDKEIRDKSLDTRDLERKDTEVVEAEIVSGETICRTSDVRQVIEAWNSLGLQTIRKIASGTDRDKWLRKRIKDYGLDDVLEAIENVRASDFLMGKSKSGWQATFDWFIRPNNFPKVLSGNYNNRKVQENDTTGSAMDDLRTLHELFEEEGQ